MDRNQTDQPGDRDGGDRAPDPDGQQVPDAAHLRAVHALRAELDRLEQVLCHGQPAEAITGSRASRVVVRGLRDTALAAQHLEVPAWLRVTRGEHRWPVAAATLVAILLQAVLPDRLAPQPRWLLPGLEFALLAVLVVTNPTRLNRESRVLRGASLILTGMISLANAYSVSRLVLGLIRGQGGDQAGPLLANGAAIWLTNLIAFALWYWEFDRGGPAARAQARRSLPDFQFVQMQNPELADAEWEPRFVDYLYLSFTNATAFSPTDVMPLSRWAKLIMMTQAAVSLVTVVLVIARAVNVLK